MFDGQGYLDLDQAVAAVESAARVRASMAEAVHGQETGED